MKTIRTIREMHEVCRQLRAQNKTVGMVPTMGALHEGHLSLARRAKDENDVTVVTIFVNPLQFGPREDFRQYPRDVEKDLAKLSSSRTDIVFLPEADDLYPDGFSTVVSVGDVGSILCGASRPGHFNGVATVVSKLFNIVTPDNAYFGQKDFQQTVVIKKLVRELDFNINIVVPPTVREHDGLAMSSRNSYLNSEERIAAGVLYRSLMLGEDLIRKNGLTDASYIKNEIRKLLKSEPLADIDYIEIVTVEQLETVEKISPPVAICIAVRIGKTRLIDNTVIQ